MALMYISLSMNIAPEQLQELREVTEDTVQYFCDQEIVSGELAWNCIHALAVAKLAEMEGICVPD